MNLYWGVAFTTVGRVDVSTVFLGIDHNLFGDGPPLLFETMVFGPTGGEDYTERYATRTEALLGHKRIVERIREAQAADSE